MVVPADDLGVFFGLDRLGLTLRMLHSFLMKEAGFYS